MAGRFEIQPTIDTPRTRRRILQGGLVALAAVPLTGLAGRLVAAAETAVLIPAPAVNACAAFRVIGRWMLLVPAALVIPARRATALPDRL